MNESTRVRAPRLWRPALAGIVALGLGLAAAELTAGLLGRAQAPVVAVGEAFVDITPGWLKDLAIDWFGTADKIALLAGMALVLATLGALIGVFAARRRAAGTVAAIVLLAVAAAITLSRPDASSGDLLPLAAAGLVAIPALDWLTRRAVAADAPAAAQASDTVAGGATRRAFLTRASAAAAFALAGGGVGRWLGQRRAGVEDSREQLAAELDLPRADAPRGAQLDVADLGPWRTPNPDFYRIDTALSPPLLRAEDWRLRVHGLVGEEAELDYGELVAMGLVDRWLTLTCVSNEVGGDLVGNAFWTGVPAADVLALARPRPEADAVLSTSDDGWTAGTPLEALANRDALLAVGMNGAPLPVEHGFPVRLVVPGLYGYVSATKWVVDLEVSRFDAFEAYWTTRGWAEQGPIKVSSRIDVPNAGAKVAAGRVAVAGVAWAQHRGVSTVEVRVDDGPWSPARLGAVPNVDTWRQWVWEWDAEPGRHFLQARAVTADGETQTGDSAPPAPDGATGWHTIDVNVT